MRRQRNGTSPEEKMMTRLQELSFAMKETELFLDGHPTNRRALAYLRDLRQEYDLLKAEYETTYAPITPGADGNGEIWRWVRTPWPWEFGFPDGGDISASPTSPEE